MNNFIINSLNSGSEIYHRKTEYTCSICKSDNLPENIFKKREVKMLLNKFKLKQMDLSTLIKKCNCPNNASKAHKLCLILNIIYNFEFNCQECNAEYNISVKMHPVPTRKCCNIVILSLSLLFNLILYGASAFLILYPLIIKKDYKDDFEQKKFIHIFYFFGGIVFLINSCFIYITISSLLVKNTYDANDYTIDIKDIGESNKGKNNNKHYNSMHKFFRNFYTTQIRFLISKKHKKNFVAKGYGYYNKELKEMIIKNNIECENELEEDNNAGKDILFLRNNKTKKKTIPEKDENINNSDMSNPNNIYSKNKNEEKKNEENNKSQEKNSKNSNSKKSEKSEKKVLIEIINTDIQNKEKEKFTKREEKKNQENISQKSKKSKNSKISDNKDITDMNNNNKKFEESKGFFESESDNKDENNESENKNKKIYFFNDNDNDNDNFDFLVSTPMHNNGK